MSSSLVLAYLIIDSRKSGTCCCIKNPTVAAGGNTPHPNHIRAPETDRNEVTSSSLEGLSEIESTSEVFTGLMSSAYDRMDKETPPS